jgi:hypothetical protein
MNVLLSLVCEPVEGITAAHVAQQEQQGILIVCWLCMVLSFQLRLLVSLSLEVQYLLAESITLSARALIGPSAEGCGCCQQQYICEGSGVKSGSRGNGTLIPVLGNPCQVVLKAILHIEGHLINSFEPSHSTQKLRFCV